MNLSRSLSLLLLLSCAAAATATKAKEVPLAPDIQPTYYSKNGKLEVTVTIGEAIYSNPQTGLIQKVVGYNGHIGGPTLYVKPGDKLEFTLINDLPREPCNTFVPELFNAYHAVDITNLHFHGLHIAARDNPSSLEVRPGERYTYSFEIPKLHNGGTFWYHPHFPGSTSLQAGGGALGMFIVQDLDGDLPPDMLNLPDLNMRVQFLNMTYLQQDYATGTSGSYVPLCQQYCKPRRDRELCHEYFYQDGPDAGQYNTTLAPDGLEYETTLVNGVETPTIDVVANQWYRVRILYVPTRFRTLEPTFPTSDGACEAHLLAKDGLYMLETPRMGVSSGFLTSGNRADWVVRCKTVGRHEFKSLNVARDSSNWIASQKRTSLNRILAYFNVIEDDSSLKRRGGRYANPDEMKVIRPARPCYAADMRDLKPDETHDLQLSGLLPNGGDLADPLPIERPPCCSETSYYDVNGLGTFNIDHRGEEGAPGREFDFVWRTGQIIDVNFYVPQIHPVHYHVNKFQIVEMPPLGSYEGFFKEGDFHDVLQTTITDYYARAVLRMGIGGPTGEMLGHCHIYRHSDRGMAYLGNIKGREGRYSTQLDGRCYTDMDERGYTEVTTPSLPSVVETIIKISGENGYDRNRNDFDILRDFVIYAGLDGELGSGDDALTDITVLAPRDKAFYIIARDLGYRGDYDEGDVFSFLSAGLQAYAEAKREDFATIVTKLLTYHLIPDEVEAKRLVNHSPLDTVEGTRIRAKSRGRNRITLMDKENALRNAKVERDMTDVETYNGLVHVITRVLIPFDDLVETLGH